MLSWRFLRVVGRAPPILFVARNNRSLVAKAFLTRSLAMSSENGGAPTDEKAAPLG